MSDFSILVTGASGFVGAHLAIDLAKSGYKVFAVGGSRLCASEVVESVADCANGDLSDLNFVQQLDNSFRPDVIVNSAALANALICERDPNLAERANMRSVECISRVFSSRPVIQISTDLVFDGGQAPEGGFLENSDPCPASVYGKTKRQAEQIVNSELELGLVARTCLVYGTQLGESAGFMGWLAGALEAGERVSLFSDEWRTPIYSQDISRGVEILARSLLDSPRAEFPIVHLAGSERLSRCEFGEILAEVKDYDSALIQATSQSEHKSEVARPSDVSLNGRLLAEEFGLSTLAVKQGLEAMYS